MNKFVIWTKRTLNIAERFIFEGKFEQAFLLLSIIVDEMKTADVDILAFVAERVKETQSYFQYILNSKKLGIPAITFESWRG